jgi:hypothetical protein
MLKERAEASCSSDSGWSLVVGVTPLFTPVLEQRHLCVFTNAFVPIGHIHCGLKALVPRRCPNTSAC